MSAIAGVFCLDGRHVDRALIELLTSRMMATENDGAAHWTAGPIALGSCTFHGAPTNFPFEAESQRFVIVMEGRLDNRDELIRTLAQRPASRVPYTDSELVLSAYMRWGAECTCHLLGDFAFAIWDAQSQKLFCAVDAMGACQIYYAKTDHFFAFASTEEALLALPGISGAPNEELIAHSLMPTFLNFDSSTSWLRDVKVTLPGQTISATALHGIDVRTYWRWEPGDELRFSSLEQAQEAFLEVLGEAVRARLRGTGPVAQMLSGGLDSASILALAKRHKSSDGQLTYHTYSAVSDLAEDCQETQCILSLANGVDATFLPVPSFSGGISLQEFARDVWSHAHPCDNSIPLPALMCQAAVRRGDRIMLHGSAGDVTLDVPPRYIAHLMRAGVWSSAWSECVAASQHNNYLFGSRPASLFALNAWTAYAPKTLKGLIHKSWRARPRIDGFPINPDLSTRLDLREKLAEQAARASANREFPRGTQDDHARLLQGPFGPSLGLAGYTRLGRRYGLEMRDPWADKRVVDFFLRLPLQYKIREGWTKFMVRSSLVKDLEPRVLWRVGKEHLGWVIGRDLMEESRSFAVNQLNQNLDLLAPYLRKSHLAPRLKRFSSARPHTQPVSDLQFVHQALTLALWLRRISAQNAGCH